MTSQAFDEFYKKLNPQQKLAVNTIEGPVMVVAGPGTGKTQVLTLRIANILLQTQINPENILALTFTESAVFQMRKRLVEIMGTPGYRVQIHTFHGFCNDVIQYNPESFPSLIASQAATELDQIQLLEAIFNTVSLALLKPFGDPLYYLRPALVAINDLKKEGMAPNHFAQTLKKQEEDFSKIDDLYYDKGAYTGKMKGRYQELQRDINKNKELLIVYKAYQKAMEEKKLYDFNDMLLEVIAAFETDAQLLLRYQERIQYVLVDEHQDTNAAQNKIVELLCSFYDNPNLFVVGDEKQAIYRFQGASLENFLYFKLLYPEAVLISLVDNYRSTQTVLDAAASLIKNNQMSLKLLPEEHDLKAQGLYAEEPVRVIGVNDYNEEYHYLAADIKLKISNGIEPSQIVVLSRNNRDLNPLVEILESKNIPYILETDANVLSDPYVQKLILLMRVTNSVDDDVAMVAAMHISFLEINPLDIYRLTKLAQENKKSLCQTIWEDSLIDSLNLKTHNQIRRFGQKLLDWKKASFNEDFARIFVDFLKESGLLEMLMADKRGVDVLDKLAGLYSDIKVQIEKNPQFNLSDFLHHLDLIQQHNISIKKSNKPVIKNAVRLMTAHKSKGLEFDHVYIINVFDGHWGHQRKRASLFNLPWEYLGVNLIERVNFDVIEDERRLFYVALTRAKREVTISYSTCSREGQEQSPAQFITEIAEAFKLKVDIQEFEKNFLSNKQAIFIPKRKTDKKELEKDFLENKYFFSELFLHRGLSATGINNFLECPWKYLFRNLLQIPDMRTKSQVFGSAIHLAVSRFVKEKDYQKNGDNLVKNYLNYLNTQSLSKLDRRELEERGKSILPLFYGQIITGWGKGILSEFSVRGVKFSEKVILNGIIDLIEPIGKGSNIRVHDFKTGKPKSRRDLEGLNVSSTGNYKRQLFFYKLLLDHYQQGRMKMTEGVIDFVEPDSKGICRVESFEITKDEIKDLEDLILDIAEQVCNLSFWNQRCKDQDCYYCQVRSFLD